MTSALAFQTAPGNQGPTLANAAGSLAELIRTGSPQSPVDVALWSKMRHIIEQAGVQTGRREFEASAPFHHNGEELRLAVLAGIKTFNGKVLHVFSQLRGGAEVAIGDLRVWSTTYEELLKACASARDHGQVLPTHPYSQDQNPIVVQGRAFHFVEREDGISLLEGTSGQYLNDGKPLFDRSSKPIFSRLADGQALLIGGRANEIVIIRLPSGTPIPIEPNIEATPFKLLSTQPTVIVCNVKGSRYLALVTVSSTPELRAKFKPIGAEDVISISPSGKIPELLLSREGDTWHLRDLAWNHIRHLSTSPYNSTIVGAHGQGNVVIAEPNVQAMSIFPHNQSYSWRECKTVFLDAATRKLLRINERSVQLLSVWDIQHVEGSRFQAFAGVVIKQECVRVLIEINVASRSDPKVVRVFGNRRHLHPINREEAGATWNVLSHDMGALKLHTGAHPGGVEIDKHFKVSTIVGGVPHGEPYRYVVINGTKSGRSGEFLLDVSTKKLIQIEGRTVQCQGAVVLADGRAFGIFQAGDDCVTVRSLPDLIPLPYFPESMPAVSVGFWSVNGTHYISAESVHAAELWNLDSAKLVDTLPRGFRFKTVTSGSVPGEVIIVGISRTNDRQCVYSSVQGEILSPTADVDWVGTISNGPDGELIVEAHIEGEPFQRLFDARRRASLSFPTTLRGSLRPILPGGGVLQVTASDSTTGERVLFHREVRTRRA